MQINAGSTLCGAQPVVVDGQVPEHERDGRGEAAQRRLDPRRLNCSLVTLPVDQVSAQDGFPVRSAGASARPSVGSVQ